MPIPDSCYLLLGCCPGCPCCSLVENLPASAGDLRDMGLIPESGRSSGVGNGKLLHTPVFLPGKFHGQRSLAGYSLEGCNELNMTEHTHSPGL